MPWDDPTKRNYQENTLKDNQFAGETQDRDAGKCQIHTDDHSSDSKINEWIDANLE